jgi:hypothetical protein
MSLRNFQGEIDRYCAASRVRNRRLTKAAGCRHALRTKRAQRSGTQVLEVQDQLYRSEVPIVAVYISLDRHLKGRCEKRAIDPQSSEDET